MIYKAMTNTSEIDCLPWLEKMYGDAGSEAYLLWAGPLELVSNSFGNITGYIMPKLPGKSLYEWEQDYTDQFLLTDVLGRLAYAMRLAYNVNVKPLVEHAGNVRASLRRLLDIVLVDLHAWQPLRPHEGEETLIRQWK